MNVEIVISIVHMIIAHQHLPIIGEESFVHYMSWSMGLNAEFMDAPIKKWLRLRHVQNIKKNGKNTFKNTISIHLLVLEECCSEQIKICLGNLL